MFKNILPFFFFALFYGSSTPSIAAPQKIDGLYVNAYGDKSNSPVIFVHGGPGHDSQDFELSTAARLAAEGLYVVVYDQRGQGRSDLAQAPTDYTYKRYADDLNLIIERLRLRKPTLIGHSHGGPISLKFDQFYPGIVSKIILVSAPIHFFRTLESIRTNCTVRYSAINDTSNLKKMIIDFTNLGGMPPVEDEVKAVSDIFNLAMFKPCDLYTPSQVTRSAIVLRQTISKGRVGVAQENLYYPMTNFIMNEQYIHVDQTEWVKDHAEYIFGIYGAEDGLFSAEVLGEIREDLNKNRSVHKFQLIDGASHSVYVYQQEQFIKAVLNILN